MDNPYLELLEALAAKSIRFVVAGGVAVVLHGVERVTMDIDIAVDMEWSNLNKFVELVRELGLKPRAPVPDDFIVDPANRTKLVIEKNALVFTYVDPSHPLKHIDVFLTEDHSFAELYPDSSRVQIRGHQIAVASIEKLINLKHKVDPPRAKDVYDISELRRIQQGGR